MQDGGGAEAKAHARERAIDALKIEQTGRKQVKEKKVTPTEV